MSFFTIPIRFYRIEMVLLIFIFFFNEVETQEQTTEVKTYTNLVEAFQNPSDIRILDLGDQGIKILPRQIGQFKNLTTLHLDGNSLTTLPNEIGQFKNLRSLKLYSNQLTTLPKEIEQLQNLRELDLNSNKLTTLPKEIGHLKNLRRLVLKGNNFSPQEKERIRNLLLEYEIDGELLRRRRIGGWRW
ncbi:leucine-rich repeat domain-containing protein [Leptospira borgpetersenii]|uniref:Leucine rich repeat protein n=1 Tax=Leptospira borgpetersenii str. Brem 328 TaxID=1049780 RepID=A0ABC9SET2_LEPBO|nr:leucine-rich repeat domain-containing protein [Leptospira borgpetersenii]EMN15221.1 leucine rich repeat protein [Leptospira borgpetersenii str. Brem 307]EMN16259.1 leucine rich repeat protein [Leptospira borgpetersenii str. Brem 328]